MSTKYETTRQYHNNENKKKNLIPGKTKKKKKSTGVDTKHEYENKSVNSYTYTKKTETYFFLSYCNCIQYEKQSR